MAYTGKKPIDHTDVTQSQSMTVTDDLTVDTNTLHVDSSNNAVGILTTAPSNASLDIGGRLRVLQDAAATTGAVIIRESSGGVGGHLQFVTNDNSGQRGFIASNSSSDILFGSSAERMRMLSAGGLTFNGDTAAANALDDYEEGDWTPVHGGNNMTQATPCKYTKIGRAVFITMDATSAAGSSATHVITGLPFTPSGSFGALHVAFATADGIQGGYIGHASDQIILMVGGTNTTDTLNAGTRIIGAGFYFI